MRYERVFLIVLDGAGAFVKDAEAPNLKGFLKDGFLTYEAQTVVPSISAECYGSMLHGVSPEVHGLNNANSGERVFPKEQGCPSVFQMAREQFPECKLASFTCWPNIGYGIIEATAGHDKVSMPDDELALLFAEYIKRNDPKLCAIVFDDTDHAGHVNGYHTEAHHRQITKTDQNVKIVLDAIEKKGYLEDSLVILCADHGGGGKVATDHGSAEPMDKTIFWGCRGKGVKADVTEEIDIRDTASAIAYALGMEPPAYFEGKVPACLKG